MRAKNPPIFQYIGLVLLFALASAYQIRSAMFSFPDYFHLHIAAYPFSVDYAGGRPLISFVSIAAARQGV